MNNSCISKTVSAILEKNIVDEWYLYFIFLLVAFVGSFLGSLVKGFGREKAKFLAIESSLNIITNQVEATTSVAEEIKNDLELQNWRKKERETLKREKLEEYILCLYIAKAAFHSEMTK